MAEDWLVIMQLLLKVHKVIDLPEVYYFYNQLNESSCSNNPTVKKVENCLIALSQIQTCLTLDISKYKDSVNECQCVLWKAMIRAIKGEKNDKTPSIIQVKIRIPIALLYISFKYRSAWEVRCYSWIIF